MNKTACWGRVNQLFAPRVDRVACGTWPTALPEGVEGTHTGNPVRAAVLERAGAGYIPPGDYPMSLLVIGGSQGAKVLSDVVPAAVAALPGALRRLVRVAHQARAEDQARVVAAYEAAGVLAEVQPFFSDIPRRLSEAQLVVSRSGGIVDCRYQRDRAAEHPDPLCGGDGGSSDGECAWAGGGGGGDPDAGKVA